MQLSAELSKLANAVHQHGGQTIIVGGSVRDYLLGRLHPKDLDLEVYLVKPNKDLNNITLQLNQHLIKL